MCATGKDGQWGRSVVDEWVEQETETDDRETERRQKLRLERAHGEGKGGILSHSFSTYARTIA